MENDKNSIKSRFAKLFFTPLLERAIEYVGDPIVIADVYQKIVWVNREFEKQTGFYYDQICGMALDNILFEKMPNALRTSRRSGTIDPTGDDLFSQEVRVKRADGSSFRAEQVVTAMRDFAGEIRHYVSVLHDCTMSDSALHQERLRAQRDALTGLPGRTHVAEALQTGIRQARQLDCLLAVIFVDLDGFKQINDCHGHLVGDAVLRTVAARLQGLVRGSDTVARFGGDEFVIVLPALSRRSTAKAVARKVVNHLAQPFAFDTGAHSIGASAGVAFFPDHGNDADALLSCADHAMYVAKQQGGRQFTLCTPELGRRLDRPPPSKELAALLSVVGGTSRLSGRRALPLD